MKKKELNKVKLENEEINNLGSDLKKYYSDVSQEIIKLVKENKLKEAIEILDAELNSSYIPDTILVAFSETKQELESQYKQKEYEKEIKDLTPLQIWDKAYDAKKGLFNISYFNLLLERKENQFDNVDLEIINKIFQDKRIENLDKVIIIITLKQENVSYDFKVFNNNLDKMFDLKLSPENNLNLPSEFVTKSLEEHYMKEPSKFHISLNILQLLYSWYFPDKIPFNDDEIVSSIIEIVTSMFETDKKCDNEISKIINKILEKENEKQKK